MGGKDYGVRADWTVRTRKDAASRWRIAFVGGEAQATLTYKATILDWHEGRVELLNPEGAAVRFHGGYET